MAIGRFGAEMTNGAEVATGPFPILTAFHDNLTRGTKIPTFPVAFWPIIPVSISENLRISLQFRRKSLNTQFLRPIAFMI